MADLTVLLPALRTEGATTGPVKLKFVENGDGTHSISTASSGSSVITPEAGFTRPNNTTAYTSGDLVANSTTAGSVVAIPLIVATSAAGSVLLRRARIRKSSVGVTNSSFRLHLFTVAPVTVTNGDNGVFSVSGVANYLGAFDVTINQALTDGAFGAGVPVAGSEISVDLTSGVTIYGLLEAQAAYTPVAQEIFTVALETWQG